MLEGEPSPSSQVFGTSFFQALVHTAFYQKKVKLNYVIRLVSNISVAAVMAQKNVALIIENGLIDFCYKLYFK